MAKVIALCQVHVEHGDKGAGNNEITNPLECYGNRYRTTKDGVGENLGNEYPADGTP